MKIISDANCLKCPVRAKTIFGRMSDAELEIINQFKFPVMAFNARETVYTLGDIPTFAYTLRAGFVKITKSLSDGRTQIVRIVVPGDFFGYDGFIQEEYNHTAIALTEIEVCRLPVKDLDAFRHDNIDLGHTMSGQWLRSIISTENFMLELGAKKAPEKLAFFLLQWRDRNGKKDSDWVDMPLSRLELAELMGLTVETVSRIISDWKRGEIIAEKKSSISIQNLGRFNRLAMYEQD